MLKTIIILENHYNPAAKQWLIDNLIGLFQKGYRTFLLEMNQEISLTEFKKQLTQLIEKMPNTDPKKQAIIKIWEMYNLLTDLKFKVKFIDPETQELAGKINQAFIDQKDNPEEIKKLLAIRELTTQTRDHLMYDIIKNETKETKDGVIFLGGYAHHTLIELLQKENYDIKLITDNKFDKLLPEFKETNSLWEKLKNNDTRQKYYGTHVQYIDLGNTSSLHEKSFFKTTVINSEEIYQNAVQQFKNKEYETAILTLGNCLGHFHQEPSKEAQYFSTLASCYRELGIKEQDENYLQLSATHCDAAADILIENSAKISDIVEKIEKIKIKRKTINQAMLDLQKTNQPALQPGK